MKSKKTEDNLLSERQLNKLNQSLIDFFAMERNEEIGIIAAGELIEFFLIEVGVNIYNHGVDDTYKLLKKRQEELNAEIELTVKK